MIVEVLGRPVAHLKETLQKIVDDISNESPVDLIKSKINEPTLVKDQKDLFTTFAEIELKVESTQNLTPLIFKYMPAHIEVVEPEELILTNSTLQDMLNDLTQRLHKYDEVVRVIQTEKQILENQIRKLSPQKE